LKVWDDFVDNIITAWNDFKDNVETEEVEDPNNQVDEPDFSSNEEDTE